MRKRQRQHEIHIDLNPDTGNFYMTIDNDEPMPICNRCLYKVMNYSASGSSRVSGSSGVFSNLCPYCAELITIENKAKQLSKTKTKNK